MRPILQYRSTSAIFKTTCISVPLEGVQYVSLFRHLPGVPTVVSMHSFRSLIMLSGHGQRGPSFLLHWVNECVCDQGACVAPIA